MQKRKKEMPISDDDDDDDDTNVYLDNFLSQAVHK